MQVLGIDVGGTKVEIASVVDGRALEPRQIPTPLESSSALIDGIEALAREVIESDGQPEAIGVGVPSQIDFATGTVIASVNIPLEGVPLRDELERRFDIPVFVDNDANVAALAEAEEIGSRNLLMLTLGTGVGGGVVIDGRIFRGASGRGAELGHMVVDMDGRPCQGSCPNRGCLESVASGTALVREVSLAVARQPDTEIGRAMEGGRELTGPMVTEMARAGDPVARGAIEVIGRALGVGLANISNIFCPQVIVIGGGVSAAGELLLEPAREVMRRRALAPGRDDVRIEAAAFGADAGMIGAAMLAREWPDDVPSAGGTAAAGAS